jgi:protein SCO1/2
VPHRSAADVRLLSVTLDPDFDTPPVLTAYARSLDADLTRWRLAGGDAGEVTRLARAFSVYVERRGALLDHTLATALVGADGRVVEIWRGSGWKVSEIVDALHAGPTRGR